MFIVAPATSPVTLATGSNLHISPRNAFAGAERVPFQEDRSWIVDRIFVFDPQVVTFCDEYAKMLAASKDDPWLLGHFSDNEMPLYDQTLDNFSSSRPMTRVARRWTSGSPSAAGNTRMTRRSPTESARNSSVSSPSGISGSPRPRSGNTIPTTSAPIHRTSIPTRAL